MSEARGWGFRVRVTLWIAMALLAVSAPWWGPPALSGLSFFRMSRVEVHGIKYLSEAELVRRLGVDTTWSIWTDLRALEDSLALHPQVQSVRLSRRLPGTLVVNLTERLPVAMIPHTGGLRVVDETGEQIQMDPARSDVDLPIVYALDSAVVRLLGELQSDNPSLFNRISEVRRAGTGEWRIQLVPFPVLVNSDVTVERLADILPVERDLAIRGARVAELDLRFKGQVIARLQ